ncbi:MAG: histidine kinase, partial [Bacteroidetes bacterium]|nr:histidine kinase [Bacteroidota bacterium]
MRTGILIVILWLQTGLCLSQNSSFTGSRLKFEDLPEGLSQNSVNCIVQDKKGFIWLGTQDGLNRFDGYGFKVYKHDPLVEGSLGSSSLWALFEDSRGNLWAGAERGGLNLYDQANDRFTQFDYEIKEDTYLSNSVVYDILEVESGILWLATSNGLVLFDVSSTTFSPPPGPVNLRQTVIWVLYQDRNNNLWIGTDGSGLWKHDLTTKEFIHYREEPNNTRSITHNSIRSVFQDRKGRLWIGTEGGGLNQFHQDGKYFTAIRYDPKNPNSLTDDDVWAILDDDHNNLIIGTDGGGLNILTNQEKMIHILPDDVNPKSINDNVIRDLYRDKQGNLWIGMFRGGANIVYNYRDKFSLYDKSTGMGLSHNSVISIAESNDGGLWIGTDGGGLNYLDSSQNTFDRNKPAINSQSSPEDDVILSILEDSNGDLWLGTYGGGLNYHKNAGKKTTRFIRSHDNSNSLSNNSVWVIYEDSNQDIWLGTNGGLNLYNKANGAFIRFQDEDYDSKLRNDNSIRAIFEDSRQNLWLGVMGGVKRIQLKTGKLTSYAFADYDSGTLSNYLVTSIYEDSQGALWLGTYGGGLVRFDEEKGPIRNYNTKDGLPNNVVYGILEDDTNNLWLSTNDGVSKFNTENFSFKNYNRDDGLQSSQFNLGAYYKDKSGRMWFGGINGLNVFYPDSILDSEDVPPVVFTDFKIFNKTVDLSDPDSPLKKHISEADEVELSYKHSVFSFEFAGLNYIYPENNQYAFKLEG